MSNPFESGTAAAGRVAEDPFWSVVRRRHPDVDIVVLPATAEPGAQTAATRAGPRTVERSVEAARAEQETRRLWQACVGDEPPTQTGARWCAGAREGRRAETTWRLDAVDPVTAVTAVDRAARVLADEGWQVVAPPDGLPRVLAGRETAEGRAEVQLVLSPTEARLVLRHRGADVLLEDPA